MSASKAPVNSVAMEFERQDFVPELEGGQLKVVSFKGSQRSGCQVYSTDLASTGITAEELERALAAEHRLIFRFKSVRVYHALGLVTSAVFQLKSDKQPGHLWYLLQENLQLDLVAALLSVKIYRLKYVNTSKKALRVKVYWHYIQREVLQERAMELNAEGRVVASALPQQQQLSFGSGEPLLDFAPAVSDQPFGLPVAAAAVAAADVGSGSKSSNSSSSGSNSSSSFAFVPPPPALTTAEGTSGITAATNSVPAINLSVPGLGPMPP
jgi:hypothetical protein